MGESVLREILRISSHFFNKIFGIMVGMYSNYWLDYNAIISMIEELDKKVTNVCKSNSVRILVISNNVLLKTIVFMYGLFTQNRIYFISPKFSIGEIMHSMLGIKNINLLIIDTPVLVNIQQIEEEDKIDIHQFFPNILYSNILFEEIYLSRIEKYDSKTAYKKIRSLITMSNIKSIVTMSKEEHLTFLSPGTDQVPCFITVHVKTLLQTAMKIKQFFGFKPNDAVMIIADFEIHPILYTILGFITGIKYVNPTEGITSVEEFKANLKKNKIKIDNLLISSDNFTKIWDYIMEKVFSNKIYFRFNMYWLTRWIVNYRIQKEIKKSFPYINKIHILNEELGTFALTHLAKSKILFTSSYGFLEQGNFLAFKHPLLFKHKEYGLKPGGTIFKSSPTLGNEPVIMKNSNTISLTTDNGMIINPGDIGVLTENIKEQGDRKFLFVYGRIERNPELNINIPSAELLERMFKDSILIKDCFVKIVITPSGQFVYNFYFNVRENLLDLHEISPISLDEEIGEMLKPLSTKIDLQHIGYAILPTFNSMQNIAGRIKYYAT